MTDDFYRLDVSKTHSLCVPADRVHLVNLTVSEDGTKWEYTLRIGQPLPEEYK